MIKAVSDRFKVSRDLAQKGLNEALRANVVINEADPKDGRRLIYRLTGRERQIK